MEESEEGVDHQRLVLFDLGSDSMRKCCLGQSHRNAAVTNIASGTNQFAPP